MTFEGLTDDKAEKIEETVKSICDEINVKLLSKFEGWEITMSELQKAFTALQEK